MQPGDYNPLRGAMVIVAGRELLDRAARHRAVRRYRVDGGRLTAELEAGRTATLTDAARFAGYRGAAEAPDAILLVNNGLHLEIVIDPASHIGQSDQAGVCDIIVEAAVTTIQDCEDSVAAVDAADKTEVYRNWLGLMRGTLERTFEKNGQPITRQFNGDRNYLAPDGKPLSLPGRSLLQIRNVGVLMWTDAVLDPDGRTIFRA